MTQNACHKSLDYLWQNLTTVSFNLSQIIWRRISHDINLSNQHCQTDYHCDSNDRQINTCKLQTPNTDVLAPKDISPEHTSQRSAECQAACAVVDADRHAVHGAPECAVRDICASLAVDLLP